MRVFLCEYVTGGGLRAGTLPPSLAREGRLMRDALMRDLRDLDGIECVTTHDDRLAAPACPSAPIATDDEAWEIWRRLAVDADVAWVVAPETGGALERLTSLCVDAGARVVGPDIAAIRIAASKRATAERLAAAGVPTAPCWTPDAAPPSGPFVIKPDDGAGCEATAYWDVLPDPAGIAPGLVVQPFVAGEAASLTILRNVGETRLLAANRQFVTVDNGAFRFGGVRVAGLDDADGRLARLAVEICRALPGLAGIFGVDLVLGADGPVVIEINPRLTTAYAGLREALGVNPASLVDPFASASAARLEIACREVEVRL